VNVCGTRSARADHERADREIIKVTHEAVGSDPEIINVVVYEIEPSNMAVNGEI